MRVEQSEPADAAATADFMIAAYQHPGCGGEQRRGGIEKVLLPGGPVVTVRTAGTASAIWWAWRFSIVVVADIDDQVGMTRGSQAGDRGEWPFVRAVAVLHEVAFEAAAGVAEHHDAFDRA